MLQDPLHTMRPKAALAEYNWGLALPEATRKGISGYLHLTDQVRGRLDAELVQRNRLLLHNLCAPNNTCQKYLTSSLHKSSVPLSWANSATSLATWQGNKLCVSNRAAILLPPPLSSATTLSQATISCRRQVICSINFQHYVSSTENMFIVV